MTDDQNDKYTFNISLAVLNSLGRNLYRNFTTILGEAISNSWDADASRVKIEINKDKSEMTIFDDGDGMSGQDFSEKFLKIGYSKRVDGTVSAKGRPYIGRKGIGKLALLSCAEKITIVTKKKNGIITGGIINNSELDDAIKADKDQRGYVLDVLPGNDKELLKDAEKGTIIKFSGLKSGVLNTLEHIRKTVALYFRFSLVDENFTIYINGSPISTDDIKELTNKTQFLWTLNKDTQDTLVGTLLLLSLKNRNLKVNKNISGFIASTEKPRDLNILGAGEKVGVDLFVNGRLREKDILRHIQTARYPENYMYGQVHYNILDSDDIDRFTSSREGVIADDKLFVQLLEDLQVITKTIYDDWDKWRVENKQEGDSDNARLTRKDRASRNLYNETSNEYRPDLPDNSEPASNVKKWVDELEEDASFNLQSYAECFISENLVRKYTKQKKIDLSSEAQEIIQQRGKETRLKTLANLSIGIRNSDDDVFYLGMERLCRKTDPNTGSNDCLENDERDFAPIRNAVMHTSRLTQEAKERLTTVYANIRAKIKNLLSS